MNAYNDGKAKAQKANKYDAKYNAVKPSVGIFGDAVDVGRRDVADVEPFPLYGLDGDACAEHQNRKRNHPLPAFLETTRVDGVSTRRDAEIAPCIV